MTTQATLWRTAPPVTLSSYAATRREEAEEERRQEELGGTKKPMAKARGNDALTEDKNPEREAAK
jgi:hypothetical protein